MHTDIIWFPFDGDEVGFNPKTGKLISLGFEAEFNTLKELQQEWWGYAQHAYLCPLSNKYISECLKHENPS